MNPKTEAPHGEEASAAAVVSILARRATELALTPRKGSYPDAAEFIVVKAADGSDRIEWLFSQRGDPSRKSGTVKLKDADSFIAYFNMHGKPPSPIYATLVPAQFTAVLNDHTAEKAGWRDFKAIFPVAHSREWDTWTKHNGKGASFGSNEAFAIFVEDNSPDIVKPEPSVMLQLALNFRVNSEVQFSLAQRLQDGNVELAYNNVINASAPSGNGAGKLKIPELFTIEIPVFDGLASKKYKVDARFRFRLADGKLTLWYELVRPMKVVEQAFKDLWEQIKKETKAPILHGTPE